MSEFPEDDDTYLQNLDSFWTELFTDTPVISSIFRGAESLMAEAYFRLLEEAASTSLANTPSIAKKYYDLITFLESDLTRVTTGLLTEYVLPLPPSLTMVEYLKDRPLNEGTILENKTDYRIVPSDTKGEIDVVSGLPIPRNDIIFNVDPFAIPGVATTVETLSSRTISALTDGRVLGGMPTYHIINSSLDQASLLSQRNTERKTFTTRGVISSRATASFYLGNNSWIESQTPIFSIKHVGLSVVVYDSTGVIGTGIITSILSTRVAATDTVYVTAESTISFELINTGILLDSTGFELVLQDLYNPANTSVYTVRTVISGLSIILDRPLSYPDTAIKSFTTCTRVANQIDIPPASTKVLLSDVGLYVFVSDQVGVSGWFKITSTTNVHTNNYMKSIGVNGSLAAFALVGLVISIHRLPVLSANVGWLLRTPSSTRRISLIGVNVSYEDFTLTTKYGQLLDREGASSTTYKNLLEGVAQYYWKGPTVRSIYSALNAMSSFPLIKTEGEKLRRIVSSGGVSTITTSGNTYTLATDILRDDLLLPENSSYTFYRLEHLSKAILVEDDYIDPTWLYGKTLPEKILPNSTATQRRVDTKRYATVHDGSWNYGDIGVNFGGTTSGESYEDASITLLDAFPLTTGALTTHLVFTSAKSKLLKSYEGKAIYVRGVLNYIKTVVSPTQLELRTPMPSISNVITNAYSINTVLVDAGSRYFFTYDVGKSVRMDDGTNIVIAYVGSIREIAQVIELVDDNGAPITPFVGFPIVKAELSTIVTIINKAPTHLNLGSAVANMSSSNIFGLSYELKNVSLDLLSLQGDIEKIIKRGKPSHSLLVNQPYSLLSDMINFTDDLRELSVRSEELFLVLDRPLAYDGTWNYGDSFTLTNGYITWNKRYYAPDIDAFLALPTDPYDSEGVLVHQVFNAIHATELHVAITLKAGGANVPVQIELSMWDTASSVWIDTGLSKILTAGFIDADFFYLGGGSIVALRATPIVSGGFSPGLTVACITVGARRPLGVEVWSNKYAYGSAVGSMVIGSDVLTDAGATFFSVDVGRELTLTFPGSPTIYANCRIVAVPSTTSIQLVNVLDSLPYTAPITSATIVWKFGAQRRWGQMPLAVGNTLAPSLANPNGILPGENFIVELPVEVSIYD